MGIIFAEDEIVTLCLFQGCKLGDWFDLDYFIIPCELQDFLDELLRERWEVSIAFLCVPLFLIGHCPPLLSATQDIGRCKFAQLDNGNGIPFWDVNPNPYVY